MWCAPTATHEDPLPHSASRGEARAGARKRLRDGEVDVLKFPVPFLHELDGGRYIGTDDLVIMRDPRKTGSTAAHTG